MNQLHAVQGYIYRIQVLQLRSFVRSLAHSLAGLWLVVVPRTNSIRMRCECSVAASSVAAGAVVVRVLCIAAGFVGRSVGEVVGRQRRVIRNASNSRSKA